MILPSHKIQWTTLTQTKGMEFTRLHLPSPPFIYCFHVITRNLTNVLLLFLSLYLSPSLSPSLSLPLSLSLSLSLSAH